MRIVEFIHELRWEQLPEAARHQARRCLLDTLGAGLGGRTTDLARIVHDFAALAYAGRGARLWQDGREVSPPGAALANGMTVDALDVHDGHVLTKGHAGAALVPAALASLSLGPGPVSGRELLTMLVAGYEVALRAGMALHATACDYHTSGAWNALGCAAMTARRLGCGLEATRHALGIAEYHGPRSPMMRCIEHPTMLKDGSGWGAMTGVSAAMLAGQGFTGAPALIVEAPDVAGHWADLSQTWRLTEQYFKPQAVCRWSQAPMEGALALQRRHGFQPDAIRRIRVATFHEAAQLRCPRPRTTEEAQYSLAYPVAAALFYGSVGPAALTGSALQFEPVLRLADRVEVVEDPTLNARFPAERVAHVLIETDDGACFELRDVTPRWNESDPPTDQDLRDKFLGLAHARLAPPRAAALADALWHCADLPDAGELAHLLAEP
jgi:2-methylcitrate dehydratase PrpD